MLFRPALGGLLWRPERVLDGVPASGAEVWTLQRGRMPRVSLLRCPAGCTSRNACSNQAVRARIPVSAGRRRGRSQPTGMPRDRVRTSRINPRRIPACNSCHVQRFLRPSCEPARTLGKSQNAYPIERGVMSAKALPFGPLRNWSVTLDLLARHNSRPFARLRQARKHASRKNGV